jgi:tetratricopeptide (TPR) repeat protein
MARRDELKAKAKELERDRQYARALEIYRRFAEESGDGAGGAIWMRIGSLQYETGDRREAATSFAKAVDLFSAEGRPNLALVAAFKLRDLDSASSFAQLSLSRLATELGYSEFARAATGTLLSSLGFAGDGEAMGAVAFFLERFPNDRELSAARLGEILRETDPETAISTLSALQELLIHRGAIDAAGKLRAEITRLDPTKAPLRPASHPAVPDDVETPEPLPLLGNSPPIDDDSEIVIAPLAGLELGHGLSHAEDHSAVLDPQPPAPPEPPVPPRPSLGSEGPPLLDLEDDGQEEESEPLPLLSGVEPFDLDRELSLPGAGTAEGAQEVPVQEESIPMAAGSGATDEVMSSMFSLDIDSSSILAELGEVATRQVEAADPASHYDVGVAFKEMGMLEDAIAQLTAALARGHNPLATLEVLGEILVGQGREKLAARILRIAARADTPADDDIVGVLYWLARSEMALGNPREAKKLFERVVRVAPDFRDAARLLDQRPAGGF